MKLEFISEWRYIQKIKCILITKICIEHIFIYFDVIYNVLYRQYLEEIRAWFTHAKQWHSSSMMNSFRQGELDFRIVKLLDLWPATVCSLHNFHFNNLYRMCSRTMTCTHVSVTLGYCSTDREISIFPVHVVCTRSRVVSQPYSKVLYFNRCFF